MKKAKTIGIDVKYPTRECKDKKCPFHGSLRVRGRLLVGRVITARAHKTVKVEFPRLHYLPKYERFEKRRTRIHAHNPTCINAVQGDNVKLMECRPLSKMKNFVLIEVIKDESSKS